MASARGWADLADAKRWRDNAEELAGRLPYFCSAVHINPPPKSAEGSRALCRHRVHISCAKMDGREKTYALPIWAGRRGKLDWRSAVFQHRRMCQNLGDGTYTIRAAGDPCGHRRPRTNITYKIPVQLHAVAMTGGQQQTRAILNATADCGRAEGDGRFKNLEVVV